MRAVRLFLRARAVIKFVLRAASTLGNTDGVQRALCKCFSPAGISLLSKGNSSWSNLADTSNSGQWAQSRT